MDIGRIIEKTDKYFETKDLQGAKRHLEYWLSEAYSENDKRSCFSLSNELMGLCRKMSLSEESIGYAEQTINLGKELEITSTISYGTALLNAATVYKAFGRTDKALLLYDKALENYRKNLSPDDSRFAGLFNNMGLALADAGRYDEAADSYEKAIRIAKDCGNLTDCAISYLNSANVYEAEYGLLSGEAKINECLDLAEKALSDEKNEKNSYYAFVCEKCAPTFGYYGRFAFENELKTLSEKIYKNNAESH